MKRKKKQFINRSLHVFSKAKEISNRGLTHTKTSGPTEKNLKCGLTY